LEVIGAVDVGDDSAGAADGGNEVGPEVVASEEMVLEAGAAEVGVDITRDDSGSEEGGPGGGQRRDGAWSRSGGWSGPEFQLAV
jgi:hypothetical protein